MTAEDLPRVLLTADFAVTQSQLVKAATIHPFFWLPAPFTSTSECPAHSYPVGHSLCLPLLPDFANHCEYDFFTFCPLDSFFGFPSCDCVKVIKTLLTYSDHMHLAEVIDLGMCQTTTTDCA